ncbi:FAD-dependent thymidylate synthase [Anthocerotibacter panamensis]|uniref:FAD-dependent thymidylate synthase n=1 Tax=Anthocerotibacter panamensis TaxID=2857077 RepID=UPI001C406179|nr:FAD-dependent thymidylate synthase [Anthocerotibacter panamensis]
MTEEATLDMADPLGDGISSVQLIQQVGDDRMIAAAARVSLANDLKIRSDEDNFKLIKYLLKHQHGTPLEHNLITYRITAPLYVIQELLRHRHLSFNQESARYIQVQNRAYVPSKFRGQSKSNRQASVPSETIEQAQVISIYQQAVEAAYKTYAALLEAGVCREQARGVLPHCTYSSLYVTFNIRALLHFLDLRLSPDAQWEIQQYARSFKALAEPLFPLTFRALAELKE